MITQESNLTGVKVNKDRFYENNKGFESIRVYKSPIESDARFAPNTVLVFATLNSPKKMEVQFFLPNLGSIISGHLPLLTVKEIEYFTKK